MTFELPPSPLGDDPARWDRLARRIETDAEEPLAAYARAAAGRERETPTWFGWLAPLSRGAPWLVAASAAATVLLWIALPPRAGDPGLAWIEPSVAPHDPAGTLLGGARPPRVDAVMWEFPPAGEDTP